MQARLLVRALIASMAATVLITGCSQNEKPAEAPADAAPAAQSAPAATADTPATTDTGAPAVPMQKTDLAPGTGAEIKAGQTALVHYTGWLYDAAAPDHKGKQFDSSLGG